MKKKTPPKKIQTNQPTNQRQKHHKLIVLKIQLRHLDMLDSWIPNPLLLLYVLSISSSVYIAF